MYKRTTVDVHISKGHEKRNLFRVFFSLVEVTQTMGEDHKPSIPRPVLAIDYSRVPYHHSLSPLVQPKERKELSPSVDPPLENSYLVERSLPINPDLPIKDVLFVFSNFSSYMRSPNQGPAGVSGQDLRHASRLLEHARVSDPVTVGHL